MNWSDEELRALAVVPEGEPLTTPEILVLATRAVELVAVRGGMMESADIAQELARVEAVIGRAAAEDLRGHIVAQGVRVAVLEAGALRWQGQHDELRAQVDALGNNFEVACRKADEQRERAERLEEELARVTARAARLDIALSERTKTYQQAAQERDAALARCATAPDYSPEHLSGLRVACSDLSRAHVRLCEEVNRLLPREMGTSANREHAPVALALAALERVFYWLAMGDEGPEGALPCSGEVMSTKEGGDLLEQVRVAARALGGLRDEDERHPCSSTCTHDDAATPGHPERAKERSEEFTAKMAEHQETADAVAKAREDGVEAMRTACWEVVRPECETEGYDSRGHFMSRLKAAIEGAAP